MSDSFSLDRRIHRDPLEFALADGLCLDRDRNRPASSVSTVSGPIRLRQWVIDEWSKGE